MKKYVIGSYSEVYDDTNNLEEAKNIFNETVEEEGEWEDIFLFEVIDEHKATSEKEYNPHPHHIPVAINKEQQLKSVIRLEDITGTKSSGWFKGERFL